MEHLPNFGRSDPIRVPYLCTDMYDGGDFVGYPSRKGWTIPNLMARETSNRAPEELPAFLQAWAYFGLLNSVFRPTHTSFDLNDFVECDEQGLKVTTKNLPKHVLRWKEWESRRTAQQRQQRFEFIQNHFEVLQRLIPRSYFYDTDINQATSAPWPGPPELLLSVVVLVDSLTWAGFRALGHAFNLDWGISPLLIARMRTAGWCPSATATLLKGQQLQNLYSASTIGSPMAVQDHVGRQCTENVCHFEQLDEATYITAHCEDCSGCASIGPSAEKVKSIIQNGGIPVVACHRTSSGISLDVVSASAVSPYVALSHVWAHGLGNPHSNTLPACQLKRLQTFVDEVAPLSRQSELVPRRWWCDTLCVPVRGDDDTLRRLAIINMRSVYQSALNVLALDSSLLRCPRNTSAVELHMRLKLSTWVRRLWTFQEAILPQEVHIRFSDGARTIQDIAASVQQEEFESQGSIYRRCSQLASTNYVPFVTRTQGDIITRFKAIWKQLQWRSTSYASDETVCLATILGLNTSAILGISPEDLEGRMIGLLRMMGKFPILFAFQPPPRLETWGFRWAPASFLNCFRGTATNPFRLLNGTATLGPDDKGLCFSNSGFIFSENTNPDFTGADDFHIAVNGHSCPSHSIGYRWKADREARNAGGASLIKSPAIMYLATDLETNPAVLVNVLETEAESQCIKAEYHAVVFVAPVAKFPDGTVRRGVTYSVVERPISQQWLLY